MLDTVLDTEDTAVKRKIATLVGYTNFTENVCKM